MPEGSPCPTFKFCKWTTSGAPSNIPVAYCLPVSSIQLLCSLIPPWHMNFDGFRIQNICSPLLSISFVINVDKSVSLFASVPLLILSSPPPQVPHLAYHQTSDTIDILIQIFQFPIYMLAFISYYIKWILKNKVCMHYLFRKYLIGEACS